MNWDIVKLWTRHTWRPQKGWKTIVLDRGAVQFDYPRSWFVEPTTGSVALFDRKPPADANRLEVSYFRTRPIDWSELSIADLVDNVTSKPRENATCGPLREEIRGGIELAWRDTHFRSDASGARACFRVCVARRGGVHCLITYEFWGADQTLCDSVWETVLDTLALDRVIADPARGPN